ncbi:hypothetical protein HUT19_15220 [Streptomyces sp. NA02950]|uniref:hypothetical protein n=1 Tax=Streptomyces sp. NA02950 TaxID=2742137 RepID=UPI001592562D|nr:hypothetical protein [Streptomyces sp. NA02950]QKV92940.1 hypothetical protein HUT19_15220 [Streptomyces sp. NA02950]
MNASPSPADIPPRTPSPDALQRQTIRDLITGTALKLSASADIDLDGLEVLAKLLDAQTRAQEASVRRWQHLDAKKRQEASQCPR